MESRSFSFWLVLIVLVLTLIQSITMVYLSTNLVTARTTALGTVSVTILEFSEKFLVSKNRVFYTNNTCINLTVDLGNNASVSTDFSAIDSNYFTGSEIITPIGSADYSVFYCISDGNTRTNGRYEIPVTAGFQTKKINLSLINDNWPFSYVNFATLCSNGVENSLSNYFEEPRSPKPACPNQFYDEASAQLVSGVFIDKNFAFKKFSGAATERSCTDNLDDEYTPSGFGPGTNGASDCGDISCASIVYDCSTTSFGFRDDPSIQPSGTVSCFPSINLCSGAIGSTFKTHFIYTYNISPEANFSIRFFSDAPPSGDSYFISIGQFNSSINISDSKFQLLNETSSSGFNNQILITSPTSIAAFTNNSPFTNPYLNTTFKLDLDGTSVRGNQSVRIDRNIESDTKFMFINFFISDGAAISEDNVSCSDFEDNNLNYLYDCLDPICFGVQGGNATYPQLCSSGNESIFFLNNSCFDLFDNDVDGTLDCAFSGISSPDLDCNNTLIINASEIGNVGAVSGICQLGQEFNCTDGFDNDRDRAYDCVLEQTTQPGVLNFSSDIIFGDPADVNLVYQGGVGQANRPDFELGCASFCQDSVDDNETSFECLDGFDNDYDSTIFLSSYDCRMREYDLGCNLTDISSNPGLQLCELIFEQSCTDGFDNDRDGVFDCNVTFPLNGVPNFQFEGVTGGSSFANGEYDCAVTCGANQEDTTSECQDGLDNDLDYWNITGWSGSAYSASLNLLGGLDCRYNFDGSHRGDPSCNGVVILDQNGQSGVCQLGLELDCTDGVDNDLDRDYNPGADRLVGVGGADCDDYDCRNSPFCNQNELVNASGITFNSSFTSSNSSDIFCLDGLDNDLNRFLFQNISGSQVNFSGGVDCIYNFGGIHPAIKSQPFPYILFANKTYNGYLPDLSCNNTAIGPQNEVCQLKNELTCNDNFDNDQDQYVGSIQTSGWFNNFNFLTNVTYNLSADCDDYSCVASSFCPSNESSGACTNSSCSSSVNWCLDSIDNDLDNYLFDGLTLNSIIGAGVDCAFSNFDLDCNNTFFNDTISGHSQLVGRCELLKEVSCDDGVDNDRDFTYPSSLTPLPANSLSLISIIDRGVDCFDYDCSLSSSCPLTESVCDDGVDNDLDAYYWSGSQFISNSSSGIDCADPDCAGLPGPGGVSCAAEEKFFDNNDLFCGDFNATGFAFDNDNDGLANCFDQGSGGSDVGCFQQGVCRVCPSQESITIDSCADDLNNEFTFVFESAKGSNVNLQYDPSLINSSLFDGVDCFDSDCAGLPGPLGLCGVSELFCNDGLDNDLDLEVDCADSDCSANVVCKDVTNSLSSCVGGNCSFDALKNSLISPFPNSIYSFTSNFGGGSVDLNRTSYFYSGQNITLKLSTVGVQGENLFFKYGSDSNAFPSAFSATNSSSFKIDDNVSLSDNWVFVVFGGGSLGDPQIDFINYPQDRVGITFGVDTPVITPSEYTFDVFYNFGGSKLIQATLVNVTALEIDSPITTLTFKNKTYLRTSLDDTILVAANASDAVSGIDFCQFSNGSGFVNEDFISGGKGDCRTQLSVFDGLQNISARAYDGVGNLGPSDYAEINVITVPRQISNFFCVEGNCSKEYPLREYYKNGTNLPIAVNFTSESGGFSPGLCQVFLENSTSEIFLGNVSLSVLGSTATCFGNVTVNVPDGRYVITVKVIDDAGSIGISGELPWKDTFSKAGLWVCNFKETATGYTCRDQCDGTPPSTPVLVSPVVDAFLFTTSPVFTWLNSFDGDGQSLTYQIQIDDSVTFNAPEVDQDGIIEGVGNSTSFNPSSLAVDKIYFWRVRAFDGGNFGNYSVVRNFSVSSLAALAFEVNETNFGTLARNKIDDTTDNSPSPLVVRNDGNVFVNATLTGTSLFTTGSFSNFQFKIRVNESGSFNSSLSQLTFTPVLNSTTTKHLVDLDFNDSRDSAAVDFRIFVPVGEPDGSKSSIITVSVI